MINIEDIENNLQNMDAHPNKVMSIMLNMAINQQARVEAILNTQAMIMTKLPNNEMSYEEIISTMEEDINQRISQLQAQIASKTL